ncbi:hypothetical protein MKW98_030796 [Papaver atlanticum]|uniref:Uncharacterized protein n=1 Tax=Papaver atlanticum TaxID=357466 RepID=A0AAD4S0C5_9MAGN|nr:hypothetical protein MKW98_030796 [Papaver atlanticum]
MYCPQFLEIFKNPHVYNLSFNNAFPMVSFSSQYTENAFVLRSKEVHKTVMKKEFSGMAKAAANQVADYFYRWDLKSTVLARLSSVHRSLKVAKSGVKKMNRQTSKKSNWVKDAAVDLFFLFYRRHQNF